MEKKDLRIVYMGTPEFAVVIWKRKTCVLYIWELLSLP